MDSIEEVRGKVEALNELCEGAKVRMNEIGKQMGEIMAEGGDFSGRSVRVMNLFGNGVTLQSEVNVTTGECAALLKESDDSTVNDKIGEVLVKLGKVSGAFTGYFAMVAGWSAASGDSEERRDFKERFGKHFPEVA